MSTAMSKLREYGMAAALMALAACGTEAPSGSQDPLRQVEIPEGFTFQTTRALTLTLQAGLTALPAGGVLSIRRADGALIYSGALVPDRVMKLQLMAPVSDPRLHIELKAEHQTWQAELTADRAELSYTFREDNS